jgi:GT2 family glycosyltransferase
MVSSRVAVTIVTYNSARFIRHCLSYVFDQQYAPLEVIIVDNASSDGTPDILREFGRRARVVLNSENTGFSAGQNQAIALSQAEWCLALNPDVRLMPDFISSLVTAGEAEDRIGSVCGKLLALSPDFQILPDPTFDSTGIYFTRNLRHLDRGSREPDRSQYDQPEYVFGATGAACLYRRAMIDDLLINGEFFDVDFFAYREDADVAWRAQLYGWKCLYVPQAVAYHVRHVVPENRSSVAPILNMHSVKNRWLMRIKNITPRLYLRHAVAITWRDLLVIGGCLLGEFSSLRAFGMVFRLWSKTWNKRREIMLKRRASDEYIASWFSDTPVSFPAGLIAADLSDKRNLAGR